MSEFQRKGRPDGVFRLVLLIGACLLGFLYGAHFFALVENPSGHNNLDTHVALPDFTEDKVAPIKLGFQNKAGIVPELYWREDTKDLRSVFFDKWLFQYIHHRLIVQPSLPFPHCQVYINHDYKFIWIKGHKVGSTAWRGPLGWLCDDHWKIPENASFDHCSLPLGQQSVTSEEVRKYWREYFVFGAVRNPYDRFASAYEYIKSHAATKGCESELRKPPFKEVCEDPYLFAVICKLSFCWCTEHHFRHFMPQAPCLLTESLLPAVDYLADVATLDSDLETIIGNINARRDKSMPPLELSKHGILNSHEEATNQSRHLLDIEPLTETHPAPEYIQDLYDQNPTCLDSVSQYFHQDFLLFGYDKGSRDSSS